MGVQKWAEGEADKKGLQRERERNRWTEVDTKIEGKKQKRDAVTEESKK